MVPHAGELISFAQEQLSLGLFERPRGSNDGPELRHFLRNTPFEPGQSWCYYFALACAIEAFGGHLPVSILRTGSCQLAADHALSVYRLSNYAATGSIFLLPNRVGHFHHAGIVIAVINPGKERGRSSIVTIEGNTNDDGSANGFGVFRHEREEKDCKYIIWHDTDIPAQARRAA